MKDALSTTDIKKRSLTGAKWLILTNGIGMPAAYLIALILGRTGPAALGAYALAQIFIGVITTFAIFGGPTVLRNFMPKVSGAEERGRFLFSYVLILGGLVFFVLSLFFFFPGLLEFLLRREFNRENYRWFILLTVVVVGSECLMGTVAGLMHIKIAAIARLMVRVIVLPIVVSLFVFNRSLLLVHTTEAILAGIFIAYCLGAVLCIIGIWRDRRFQMRFGWRLPTGFIAFAFTSSAAMVFSFFYMNFDRMCVLGLSNLAGLGMYQAVISLSKLIEVFPTILQTAIVPVFSGLQDPKHFTVLKRAFSYVSRNLTLLITLTSLVMIGFSRQILGLFGTGYGSYYYLLSFYCFVCIVRAPAFPCLAILISTEKNSFRLCQSTLQLIGQFVLTLLFIDKYGVLAIAGAKMLTSVISSLVGTVYVTYGLRMAPKLARSYRVALIAALTVVIFRIWIIPSGWVWSAILTGGGLAAFAIGSRLTVNEARDIFKLLTTRNFNVSAKTDDKDF